MSLQRALWPTVHPRRAPKQTPPNRFGLGGAGGWRHRSGFGGKVSKAHARKYCGSW